jgi:tetratricopeptide (TPR) repeat protein
MKKSISILGILLLFSSLLQAQLSVKEKRQMEKLYNEGVNHLLSGDYTNALSSMSNCIQIDQSNAKAYLQRGRAQAALGDLQLALNDIDLAINYDKDLGEAYFYKGYFLFGKDTSSLSEQYLQLSLDKGFELPETYYYLGLAGLLKGEDDIALINFNKAIIMKDNYALAYHDRAGIKRRLGDYNGALYDYKTAVNYMELFPLAYNNMGSVKLILGDYTGALSDFTTAIEQDPKLFIAYNNRGFANYQLGEYDSAFVDFSTALELSQDFTEAKFNSASVLAKKNELAEAIQLLDQITLDSPELGIVYLNRGLIKEMKGDILGACMDWNRALELGEEEAAEYLKECKN